MLIGQRRTDYDRRSRLTASEAEPECQREYFGVVFKTLANLFLARVLTETDLLAVLSMPREKKGSNSELVVRISGRICV